MRGERRDWYDRARVRETVQRNPGFVVVKTDFDNWFNRVHRRAILRAVLDAPLLRPSYRMLYKVLAPKARLYLGSRFNLADFESAEGGQQGNPAAPMGACAAFHSDLVALDAALSQAGGFARFQMDDGYVVGPPALVFPAVARFRAAVEAKGGRMRHSKMACYSAGLTATALAAAGKPPDIPVGPGIICSGIPIGSPVFVQEKLTSKVDCACSDVTKISNSLRQCNRHSLWTLLYYCLAPRMDFWAQLSYPLDVLRHLERFDRCLLDCASEPLARGVTHDPLLCARLQLPTRF